MKLAAYLTANEVPDVVFAEKLGVTRQTLWRYKSGERRPEWDVLERIKRETGGQVTPNDFLDDAPPVLGGGPASARWPSDVPRPSEVMPVGRGSIPDEPRGLINTGTPQVGTLSGA